MGDDVTFRWSREAYADLIESSPIAAQLGRSGLAVETEAKRSLHQPGQGRLYRRGGVEHRASAPGDPPATDRGLLAASITTRNGRDGRGIFVDIGSPLRKALGLELGTRHIAPRPFLRPALVRIMNRRR